MLLLTFGVLAERPSSGSGSAPQFASAPVQAQLSLDGRFAVINGAYFGRLSSAPSIELAAEGATGGSEHETPAECHHEELYSLTSPQFWWSVLAVLVTVCVAAIASGMTVGLFRCALLILVLA